MAEKQSDIWEKVYHTDSRVSAMETKVGAIESQVNTIGHGVERIEASLMNKPEPNYSAWIGGAITILGGLLAVIFGIVQYVDLTLEPIYQRMSERQEPIDEFWMFKNEMHYEMGRIHERWELVSAEMNEQDARIDEAENNINTARISAAGALQRLEYVTAELNKIDLYGSRRWGIGPDSE